MRAARQRRQEHGGDGLVEARELVEAIVVKGEGLSLNAHKVLLLMIRAAGGDAWQDREHSIAKVELTGSHRGHDRLRRILKELRIVQVRVRHKSERGVASDWEAALVSETDIELSDDARAIVTWRFSGPMREILRTSDIYADLRLDVVVPLESVYSLRLYELGCLHLKRQHPVWRGTREELRAMLRVPAGTYRDWTDLRRKTLETAKAELDHIAPFTLDWQITSRRGRSVDEVTILFTAKNAAARAAAEAELQKSRIGRKARRAGTVEEVKAISPALAADLDKLRHD
jgi:plasmid replication initiation protein